MANLEAAIKQMRWLCDEGNVGYCWEHRWSMDPGAGGGETDCSAMVISVLKWAGFATGSASYTGDLSANLCANGWERLPADISTCKPGDLLLNDSYHVCMVTDGTGWDALVSQASINEYGGVYGGEPGDQTGWETNTTNVYTYSHGWDCILRYTAEDDGEASEEGTICGVEASTYRRWIRELQAALSERLHAFGVAGVDVDGIPGPDTQAGVAKLWQASCNTDWRSGLEVDGIIGPATLAAVAAHPVGYGCETQGNDVWAVKAGLVIQGWDCDLLSWEWTDTDDANLRGHQEYYPQLEVDGICGPETLKTLLPLALA